MFCTTGGMSLKNGALPNLSLFVSTCLKMFQGFISVSLLCPFLRLSNNDAHILDDTSYFCHFFSMILKLIFLINLDAMRLYFINSHTKFFDYFNGCMTSLLIDICRDRRLELLMKWRKKGGVFLIGYTNFRNLSLGKHVKDRHMAKEFHRVLQVILSNIH